MFYFPFLENKTVEPRRRSYERSELEKAGKVSHRALDQ